MAEGHPYTSFVLEMVFKRRKLKSKNGQFYCLCGLYFNRRRALYLHQGTLWPGCPVATVDKVVYR